MDKDQQQRKLALAQRLIQEVRLSLDDHTSTCMGCGSKRARDWEQLQLAKRLDGIDERLGSSIRGLR